VYREIKTKAFQYLLNGKAVRSHLQSPLKYGLSFSALPVENPVLLWHLVNSMLKKVTRACT